MTVEYSDLFLISIIPIIIQGVAGFYLFRLHRILGRRITLYFGIINGLMFWFDVTIAYLLYIPESQLLIIQSVQSFGIFIGFVVPIGVAILLFILQKRLKDALMPPPPPPPPIDEGGK